ncbi:MAG: metallopeptidase family protein [bacterium]|nr:metallopeptidase family protein [bacterium]
MLTFEECGEMLDDIVDEMPRELFRELNGGVILMPQSKLHPCAVNNDLYILGEYRRDNLGKYIAVFYGSVATVYGNLPKEEIRTHLTKIMHHEVRHHNEYLAGCDDLGLYDKQQIQDYLQKKGKLN